MTLREAILIGCLVALGVVSFHDRRAENQRQLAALAARERQLAASLRSLRERGRALRLEADALTRDRYYVERLARADLGWRPSPLRDPGVGPQPPEAPSALAQGLPSLPPRLPSPVSPQPLAPPPQQ